MDTVSAIKTVLQDSTSHNCGKFRKITSVVQGSKNGKRPNKPGTLL